MQIGPVPEVRIPLTVKAPPVDPQLTALFDIEGIAPAGDDSYSGGARKAAGAEEDEKDELAGEEKEAGAEPSDDGPVRSISYFA